MKKTILLLTFLLRLSIYNYGQTNSKLDIQKPDFSNRELNESEEQNILKLWI